MIRAYHRQRGDLERTEVLVPDSSHGTNPATASMAGFTTVTDPVGGRRRRRPRRVPGGARPADGRRDDHQPVDARAVRGADRRAARCGPRGRRPGLHGRRQPQCDPRPVQAGRGRASTSCTSTSTRRSARRMAAAVRAPDRSASGRSSCRSCRRRGSSGPTTVASASSGPASARRRSAGCARSSATPASSSGPTPTSGPTAASGLREVSDDAVLAANYLKTRARRHVRRAVRRAGACKHEFVASAATIKKATGVRTLDIAKRLIDYGYHPPTIYFPLIVEEGMLIEPTETESIETLDAFAEALIAIAARGPRRRPSSSTTRRTTPRSAGSTRPRRPASRTCAGGRWRAPRPRVPTDREHAIRASR